MKKLISLCLLCGILRAEGQKPVIDTAILGKWPSIVRGELLDSPDPVHVNSFLSHLPRFNRNWGKMRQIALTLKKPSLGVT